MGNVGDDNNKYSGRPFHVLSSSNLEISTANSEEFNGGATG